jgi:hypothetical protein
MCSSTLNLYESLTEKVAKKNSTISGKSMK